MSVTDLDRATKILLNKKATSSSRETYEEVGASTLDIHDQDIYTSIIDSDPSVAIAAGVVELVLLFPLTVDPGVSFQQGWILDGYADVLSDKYGSLYTPRLFDSSDNEIFPTDALDWFINPKIGYLTINGDASLFSQPFKSTFYRYIGKKGNLIIPLSSPSLTIVTSQVEFDAALGRFSDGFTGQHQIECRGFTVVPPVVHPIPDPAASLMIFADRSSSIVSNIAPSFSLIAGKRSQLEDVSFGVHAGIASGTAWISFDISSFPLPNPYQSFICLQSPSPVVRYPRPIALPTAATIYQYSTILSFPSNYVGSGGGRGLFLNGVTYVGFIINSGSSVLTGFNFEACRFDDGRLIFNNCNISGYYNSNTSDEFIFSDGSYTDSLHIDTAAIGLSVAYGARDIYINNTVLQAELTIRENSSSTINNIDIDTGQGILCEKGSFVNLSSVSANGEKVITIEGIVESNSNAAGVIGSITGNAITVENGGLISKVTVATWTLIVGGNDVVVDGNPYTFSRIENEGVISLTTLSAARN